MSEINTEKFDLQQDDYGRWVLTFTSDEPDYWIMTKEQLIKLAGRTRKLAKLFEEKGF